jgi:hypothetical protein
MRKPLLTLLLLGLGGGAAADPAFDYLLHCGGCHLENGAGDPPIVPDLREHTARFASYPAGRAYLVQVPGSSQAPLTDAALAELLNWLLPRVSGGQPFEPFTADEIGGYRSATLLDPLARRAELLAREP